MDKKYWAWVVGLLLVIGYIWLANDGQHYWHEFRYLYSASFYSTSELMHGVFDPGPPPVRTSNQVADWYATKLFHIYILKQLVGLFGMGYSSYLLIKYTYAGMLLTAVMLMGAVFKSLEETFARLVDFLILFLFSPLIVYLGFELMPEVPSFLFSVIAISLFMIGWKRPNPRFVFSVLAGFVLALSALANWRVPFLFFGFWIAYIVFWTPRDSKRQLVLFSLVTFISFLVVMFMGLRWLGGSFQSYFSAIKAFFSFNKQLPMWMFAVFNLGLIGMGAWLLLPLGIKSPNTRFLRFLIAWLLFSTIPILLSSSNYLEPRYLLAGSVPFVALATLGLEYLWKLSPIKTRNHTTNLFYLGICGIVIFFGSWLAQRWMPYELDENNLLQAVSAEASPADSAIILLPWNYTDFHFLKFIFPDRPIYLVQSATTEEGERVRDPAWTALRTQMYGDAYLPNSEALDSVANPNRRLIYIGWTILPSLQNLHDDLTRIGLNRLAGWLEASDFLDHLSQSWLWDDPQYPMREIDRYGQYHVYDIVEKSRQKPTSIVSNKRSSALYVPGGSIQVPLWGMFEVSIINNRDYIDPFMDTQLDAVFRSPFGSEYPFFGFFDGDGNGGQSGTIWKLRFMCLEAGTWSWTAAFSDGAPGGSGSFECVESNLPGPLRVDPVNSRGLEQANGDHFLPRWYYLHELLFENEGDWQQDIDNLLVNKGYNMVTVLFTQAEVLLANGWDYREYEQPLFYPWVKDGSTVEWNTYDIASWDKLDRILKYLQDRGIYLYNFDGFFPNLSPRFPDDQLMEESYLRYALARTGAYWNIIHNITFEFSEFMSTSRLNRIGHYIENIDPFGLLLTVHDTQNYDALVQDEIWLDMANLQYAAGTAAKASVTNSFILNHFRGKPVAATEVVWEGTTKLTADEVRRGGWGVLMAGSFFLYGEFDLDGPGVGPYGAGGAHPYIKIMLDFLHGKPYWEMTPHNELVNSGNFSLAEPGVEYIVYAENGGPVTLDLQNADGTFQVQWLNPRTGVITPAGTVVGGGKPSFSNPVEDQNDWVLYLHKTNDTQFDYHIFLPITIHKYY